MAKLKTLVKSRAELAAGMARMEGGKSEARVGDIRQLLKLLIYFEAKGYATGHRSIFSFAIFYPFNTLM